MEQLLDKIAKAPPAVKYGGLAALVVLLSVLNFFFGIQPLQDSIAEQENQQRGLDRQLAEKQEIAQQLNDIGKKSGLEISRVEPGGETNATFFAKIPIKMSVSGNFHEIAMFMQEIANMRRIVNVNNIKLGTPVLKNDKVVLSSEFLATTFRFVDQAAQPAKKAGE